MVKLGLFLQAELDGVTSVSPIDTTDNPYFYTFKVQCNSCHEINGNWITISRQEKATISGSRGEANFVWKCKNCRRESSASKLPVIDQLIQAIESSPALYTVDMASKPAKLIEFECRGCEFTEFNPDGNFSCQGEESGTKFENIDLSEFSWYDYDEKAAREVSITEIVFSIRRA